MGIVPPSALGGGERRPLRSGRILGFMLSNGPDRATTAREPRPSARPLRRRPHPCRSCQRTVRGLGHAEKSQGANRLSPSDYKTGSIVRNLPVRVEVYS